MGKFDLSSDDVVSSMEPEWELMKSPTFKIEQVQRVLAIQGRVPGDWLSEQGVKCEVLSVSQGGGWRKGKVRIRFEFVEDEPQPAEAPDVWSSTEE